MWLVNPPLVDWAAEEEGERGYRAPLLPPPPPPLKSQPTRIYSLFISNCVGKEIAFIFPPSNKGLRRGEGGGGNGGGGNPFLALKREGKLIVCWLFANTFSLALFLTLLHILIQDWSEISFCSHLPEGGRQEGRGVSRPARGAGV